MLKQGACLLWMLLFAVTARADTGVVLIDVRSAQEYAGDHLVGAINIPHDEIRARIGAYVTDQATSVYVYCRSGQRSGVAQEALIAAGYTSVVNLGGLDQARARWPQVTPLQPRQQE